MSRILDESTIGLNQAGRIMAPRGESPLHKSTLLRMIMRGTRDRDGNNIRLEAVKVGRKWLTSQEAVRRFAEALTEGWGPGSETNSPRSKYERNRAADAALAELAAAGVATVESGAGR